MKKMLSVAMGAACIASFAMGAANNEDPATPPKEILAILNDHTPLAPTQVFDNLYCIGTKSVVAWALKTSEGIVLIDSMWDDNDAKLIEKGLKLYGLDAKDIKLIIITHGHGDHYGGASYLAKKYGAKVLMSKKDTEFMLSYNEGPNIPKYPKPKVDKYVEDGEKIILGDTQIISVETPGHTVGGISLIFPIKYNGKSYEAMLWGGTGIPNDKALQKAYRSSLDKFEKYVKEYGVTVELTAHLFQDNGYSRLESVYNESFQGTHPFIVGKKGIEKFFTTYKKMVDDKLKN
ncbi:MBL fold hydrolase [Helicobacter anseris]|uniref:MBL fold hydrolase n=1 Tax=Helicobacter anseris TaxID=375926 RepID=A0A3D8J556_9HELI|nr:MBL fold metallo-hydrolase [Helicobacter anseris]RDU72629.1 MBL fold hydrolase [Helicobacter anseris]